MTDTILFSASAGDIKSEPVDDSVFNSIPSEPELDTPPKTGTFLDEPAAMPDVKSKRATKLQTQIEGTYVTLGTALFMFDSHTGGTIIQQAPECAKALDELAKTNPAVKRALENAMATSAWGAVIAAHLPIIIMVGTKYVPPLKEKLIGDTKRANQEQPIDGYQEYSA